VRNELISGWIFEMLFADPLWPWLRPGSVAIHYVLPVLWMTSRIAVVGHMAGIAILGAESDV